VSALISSQILHLSSADGLWRAEVSSVGAALVSLWCDDVEIVSSPYHQPLQASAGIVMAPWPNRLEDGTWQMGDRKFVAPINDAQGHNANHGLALGKEFEITQQTESRLRLETNLFDQEAYPFRVLLSVSFHMGNDGLQINLEARNLDGSSVPIAFGLHPYFVCDADSQLELLADTWISKNERSLPVSALPIENSTVAKRGFNLVRELEIDDCFTGLAPAEEGHVTRLTRPEHKLNVEVSQSSELSHLMIYKFTEDGPTQDNAPARMLLAIEPQSAPANVFRNLEQVKMLSPNQAFSATCKITQRKNA
jgi:aldose 1-epimerase